jgi:hypothetical protein
VLLAAYEAAANGPAPIHTIVGVGLDMGAEGTGDGVVAATSAKLPYAASEALVPANHHDIHHHPRTILEVKRILRLHLRETGGPQLGKVVPATGAEAPDVVIPAK